MGDTYIDSDGYPRFKNSGKLVHQAVAENKGVESLGSMKLFITRMEIKLTLEKKT